MIIQTVVSALFFKLTEPFCKNDTSTSHGSDKTVKTTLPSDWPHVEHEY